MGKYRFLFYRILNIYSCLVCVMCNVFQNPPMRDALAVRKEAVAWVNICNADRSTVSPYGHLSHIATQTSQSYHHINSVCYNKDCLKQYVSRHSIQSVSEVCNLLTNSSDI